MIVGAAEVEALLLFSIIYLSFENSRLVVVDGDTVLEGLS
jgi:hypothetical protein